MTAGQAETAGEWCDRDCEFHWRVQVGNGPLIILRLDSSDGEAYLSPEEADAIGDALKDYARDIRQARERPGPGYDMDVRGLVVESHDAGRKRAAARES